MRNLSLAVFVLALIFPSLALAQQPTPQQTYMQAKVISVDKQGKKDIGGKQNPFQELTLQITNGTDKGKQLKLEYGGGVVISDAQKVKPGETIILAKVEQRGKTLYSVADRYRLPSLVGITLLFFALVLLLTGKKGLGSIAGLLISLLIIIVYIVPRILAGGDPLLTSILGSLVIMFVTLYLAHGFNQRTTLAVIATFASLILTGIIAVISVNLAKLSGLGTEDAYNLLLGSPTPINLQGLLLGGIIIGALGVLDDTTTTQSTTIAELAEANPSLGVKDLFSRGMIIGKEHIASLVNTLVLAYAGAGIGIFIFIILALRNNTQPLWVILNSELLSEEIIRTLAGSLGLVLAVPITTFLAAFFARNEIKIK